MPSPRYRLEAIKHSQSVSIPFTVGFGIIPCLCLVDNSVTGARMWIVEIATGTLYFI